MPSQSASPAGRDRLLVRLGPRLEIGRAMRRQARAMVLARGPLAERAAWSAARAPDLSDDERRFREGVAIRVSRMFAFVGIEHQH
jgi:hypothetical protein